MPAIVAVKVTEVCLDPSGTVTVAADVPFADTSLELGLTTIASSPSVVSLTVQLICVPGETPLVVAVKLAFVPALIVCTAGVRLMVGPAAG